MFVESLAGGGVSEGQTAGGATDQVGVFYENSTADNGDSNSHLEDCLRVASEEERELRWILLWC